MTVVQDALHSWRKKAHDRFLALGFPSFKQEAFQYLPLSKLQTVWPEAASRKILSKEEIASAILPECKMSHLVFVDGYFEPSLSCIPPGLICLPLDAALKSYGLFLQNRWAKNRMEDPFFLHNGAFQGLGAFLYVPPQTELFAPLQVLHVLTGHCLASPHLQVTLGAHAKLTLAQTISSSSQGFCNGVIDAALEREAALQIVATELLPASAWSLSTLHATLKRGACLKALHATNGAETVRLSAHIELLEENSSMLLQGLSMLAGQRQSHIHALIEHVAPHCQSRQHMKTVLSGKAKASFEGKILVQSAAQKTEAYQLNNNLLLSDEVTVYTKPNLEIFADDVKASHGATVAQLQEEELFYLRSRGISTAEAKTLLLEGFCRELIDGVGIASLQNALLAEMRALHA